MDVFIKKEIEAKIEMPLNLKAEKKILESLSSPAIQVKEATLKNFTSPIENLLAELQLGKTTEEDKKLVASLLKNNVAVNKETFTNLKRAVNMYNLESEAKEVKKEVINKEVKNDIHEPLKENQALQKAIFTIANNIKVSMPNISAIENLSENLNFYKQLEAVSESLQKTEDFSLREAISKILNKNMPNESVSKEVLIKNFSFELAEKEQIDLKLEVIHKNFKEAFEFVENKTQDTAFVETLTEEAKEEIEVLKKNLQITRDTCSVLTQIRDVIYIPLPINILKEAREAELYIFKNNKPATEKGAVSALISLNMTNMGRVETYIYKEKEEQNLKLEFKLENREVQNIIKENILSLNTLLASYNVTSITYSKLEEPFNITKTATLSESVKDPSYSFERLL